MTVVEGQIPSAKIPFYNLGVRLLHLTSPNTVYPQPQGIDFGFRLFEFNNLERNVHLENK